MIQYTSDFKELFCSLSDNRDGLSSVDIDFNVAKLRTEPTKDILKSTITKLAEEWQKMDDCILKTSVPSKLAARGVLSNSLSRGVIFDKIPEEKREGYREQLETLSEKVPRVRGNTSIGQLHTMRTKSIHDIQVDRLLSKIPDLLCTYKEVAVATNKTVHTTQSSQSSLSTSSGRDTGDDVILSLAMYSAVDPFGPQQEVQLLGSHTLDQLVDILYCLHGEDGDSFGSQSDGCFLFVEGVFLVDSRKRPLDQCAMGVRKWMAEATAAAQKKVNIEEMAARVAVRKRVETTTTMAVAAAAVEGEPVEVINVSNSVCTSSVNVTESQLNSTVLAEVPLIVTKKARKATAVEERDGFLNRFECPHLSLSGGAQVPLRALQDSRCDGVALSLGRRYLYSHFGCEHFLYLTDMRVRRQDEDVMLYPRTVFQKAFKRRRCCACDVTTARFMVFGDRLAEANPSLFCESCHHMLHYSEDGQSLLYSDFRVFPYKHDV